MPHPAQQGFQQNDWCTADLITNGGRTKAFINANMYANKKGKSDKE